ncbi:MAG TPA: cell division protein FtsH, partial [Devosia sp.]|nr:cell division protein FtsH [Devosia sp.]
TANEIDDEVREIVEQALQRTLSLLENRRESLERAARELLAKESLDEADLRSIVEHPASSKPDKTPEQPRVS